MNLFGRMMSNWCGHPSHQPGKMRSGHSASRHKSYTDAADAAAAIAATAVRSHSRSEPSLQHLPGIGSKRPSSEAASRRGSIDVSAAVAAAERVASMTHSHNKQLSPTPEDATKSGQSSASLTRQCSSSHPGARGRGGSIDMGAGSSCSSSHNSPTHSSGQRRSLDLHHHSHSHTTRPGPHRRSLDSPAHHHSGHRQQRDRPGSPRSHSVRPSLDIAAAAAASGGSHSSSCGSPIASRLAARQAALAACWGRAEAMEGAAAGAGEQC